MSLFVIVLVSLLLNLTRFFNYSSFFTVDFEQVNAIPLILPPTRINSHSNTLIDNIFSNVIDLDIISGNLTATISDHLPQFAIIPNMFGNILGNK